ncbi:MAG: insulinase family protein [Planctomycetota bacterium]|nr:MAG: insulinase family protein [Planctomycetota bacterium]
MSHLAWRHFSLSSTSKAYLLKTEKFKTITLHLYFLTNLEDLPTQTALLPYVLRRTSQEYNSLNELYQKLEALYGASLQISPVKIGDWQLIRFSLVWPNEKYFSPSPQISLPILKLLHQILYFPKCSNGSFPEQDFALEKKQMELYIQGLINDRTAYAFERFRQHFCPNDPYRLFEYGNLEELAQITAKNLYQFYEKFLKQTPYFLYLVGDVEPNQWEEWINSYFLPPSSDQRLVETKTLSQKAVEEKQKEKQPLKTIVENLDIAQAQLVLGWKSWLDYSHPSSLAFLAAQGVLGGFAHSKLFFEVREKAGLAYTIASSLDRHKGFLTVYGGIAPENFHQAVELIRLQVEKIAAGEITDFEMQSTTQGLLSGYQAMLDAPTRMIAYSLSHHLHHQIPDLEKAKKTILSLTPQHLAKAFQTIYLDTIYLLRPK